MLRAVSAQARRSARPGRSLTFLLLPRFDEPIAPEFYRQTGWIRIIAALLLFAMNVGGASLMKHYQTDEALFWRLLAVCAPFWILDALLSVAIWKGGLSTTVMRRLTIVCLALETVTILLNLQAIGSVSSHGMVLGIVIVLIYRVAFDFSTGVIALLVMLLGHWGVVVCEVTGIIAPHPFFATPPGLAYVVPAREIGSMINLTGFYLLTFLIANWSVARMRHKELTIRFLRESLYASGMDRVGQHTGRQLRDTYEVGALIGTGGMGEVYKGRHLRTRREVAVKLLHPHLLEDPTLLKRFRREAEVAGRLGSQHIVEILDVDEDEGQPFLVFELLVGESLGRRVGEHGALAFDALDDLVQQLARGLEAAHAAGVVHRDLKPENVFLCPREEGGDLVKILDFGVSKIHGAATAITQEVAILGTPEFMAPEQALGRIDEIDVRTDIHATGALAYYAITGRRPFGASSVPVLLRKICDEAPTPVEKLRPGVPAGVGDVIAIAMAKLVPERYGSVRELAADLSAALRGEPNPEVSARAAKVTRGEPPPPPAADMDSINPAGDTQPAIPVDADTVADRTRPD